MAVTDPIYLRRLAKAINERQPNVYVRGDLLNRNYNPRLQSRAVYNRQVNNVMFRVDDRWFEVPVTKIEDAFIDGASGETIIASRVK